MEQRINERYQKEFPRGSTVEIEISCSIYTPGEIGDIRKYVESVVFEKMLLHLSKPSEK